MKSIAGAVVLTLAAVGLAATPAWAQEGAIRVARLTAVPEAIELTVGESYDLTQMEILALDEGDQVVPGVTVLRNLRSRAATLDGQMIRTHMPGDAALTLTVPRPSVDGRRVRPLMLRVPIHVRPLPVAQIEVVPPPFGLYAGSVLPIEARITAADGSARADAEVTWSSRNPDVARVDAADDLRTIAPGRTVLTATAEGVEGSLEIEVVENPIRVLELTPTDLRVRTGDVVRFEARAIAGDGSAVDDAAVTYTVAGGPARSGAGAQVFADGAFVAERPGLYRVVATAGGVSAEGVVQAVDRGVRASVEPVGLGVVSYHPTSDLWVFEGQDGRDYAYVGTHSGGQKMYAWDVTDPTTPLLTDSVVVDARVVNDVKVNESGTLAVITREGASSRRNGIVVLDLADPAHPTVMSEYTETVTGGVHNTFWHGDLVYAVHNGTSDIHIIDLSDPTAPEEVGRWGLDTPGKLLHDVWIVDGLAYASYWDDGVWILDVGDGRWGGTPISPVPVSHYAYADVPGEWGNTHVAFPYTNADGHPYLFVGDEVFGCDECVGGPRGYIHVLDMKDVENPVEVARYEVPEAGTHNVWVEDDTLYVAYYQAGLRVVDVSGELRGDLYRQGREVAWFPTGTSRGHQPNAPMAWGPQPYKGRLYVSDMNSGLWVVRLEPKKRRVVP